MFDLGKYHVNEIFSSLQGEGLNTGRPAVFVRLAHCNLSCNWCDTSFDDYEEMTVDKILDNVQAFDLDSVIVTGGEPTIHAGFAKLIEGLKAAGYWVALETNGIRGLLPEVANKIDYISVSPKAVYAELYKKEEALAEADEVRVVADGDVSDFCEFIEERIPAGHYFVSPRSNIDDTFDVLQAMEVLNKLNRRTHGKKWALSFQTHKLAGIH